MFVMCAGKFVPRTIWRRPPLGTANYCCSEYHRSIVRARNPLPNLRARVGKALNQNAIYMRVERWSAEGSRSDKSPSSVKKGEVAFGTFSESMIDLVFMGLEVPRGGPSRLGRGPSTILG